MRTRMSLVKVPVLRLVALVVCAVVVVATLGVPAARAISTGTAVASMFPLLAPYEDGDVVSYEPVRGVYLRTTKQSDPNLFGVVVLDPVFVVSASATGTEGTVPLIRFGEATVRVSDQAGAIAPGDRLRGSNIPGVAVRAGPDESGVILGIALAPFPGTAATASLSGAFGTYRVGKIPVALRIGPYRPGDGENSSSTPGTLGVPGAGVAGGTTADTGALLEGQSLFDLLRYVLAATVALGALFIALRNFGGSLSESIASVGRNPLARTYILSMMFWNSMLIMMICLVGFGIGAFIIMYPL